MTALADNRLATFQQGTKANPDVISYRVAATTTIYQGALVVLNAGFAVGGTTATGLIAVGRADEKVVNSGSAGAKRVKVRQGVFPFNNATAGDACTTANVGSDVYVLDDNTVTITSTGRSKAGKLVDILDNGQCMVLMGLGVL